MDPILPSSASIATQRHYETVRVPATNGLSRFFEEGLVTSKTSKDRSLSRFLRKFSIRKSHRNTRKHGLMSVSTSSSTSTSSASSSVSCTPSVSSATTSMNDLPSLHFELGLGSSTSLDSMGSMDKVKSNRTPSEDGIDAMIYPTLFAIAEVSPNPSNVECDDVLEGIKEPRCTTSPHQPFVLLHDGDADSFNYTLPASSPLPIVTLTPASPCLDEDALTDCEQVEDEHLGVHFHITDACNEDEDEDELDPNCRIYQGTFVAPNNPLVLVWLHIQCILFEEVDFSPYIIPFMIKDMEPKGKEELEVKEGTLFVVGSGKTPSALDFTSTFALTVCIVMWWVSQSGF